VTVVFTDEGPGMGEETINHAFDPFFSTRDGGEGLGLSIALTVLERHQGTIQLESEEGQKARCRRKGLCL